MTSPCPPDRPEPPQGIASDLRLGLSDAVSFCSHRLFWALLGLAVVVTTLSGPFGTYESQTFPVRLMYWSLINGVATVIASTLSLIALRLSARAGRHWVFGAFGAGVLAVPPVLALTLALEQIVPIASPPMGPGELLAPVAVPLIGVTLIVNALVVRFRALRATGAAPPVAAHPAPVPPAPVVMQRLPEALGQDIVCLKAQDHYVEVTTTLGRVSLLLRLGDAERDLAPIPGLRVHRSWWVALAHVVEISPDGAELTTSQGQTIPVARGQRATLRAALKARGG